jgi:predicted molibdopterin-dependent oxidoreductase YjgC
VINAVTHVPQDTTKVADFAEVNLIYKPGTEIALIQGMLNVMFAENLLPDTPTFDMIGLRKSVADWMPEKAAAETGVSEADIAKAARLLAQSPVAILAGKDVTEHPYFVDVVNALGNLVVATGNEGNLNLPGLECNTQGAMDMGVLPDVGPGYQPLANPGLNTHQMLTAAANGQVQFLWLVGVKLRENYYDADLVRNALTTCPFVVVNELTMTETAELADLVLPAASMAEKDGTYTNCERRVQRIYKAFEISPDIKPDWIIFSEVAAQMGGGAPFFSARDVLREIAACVPIYRGITPKSLGEWGQRWHYAEREIKPSIVPVNYAASAL